MGHMGFRAFWDSSWLKNLIRKILILSPNPFNFIGQILLKYLSVQFQSLMLRVSQVECPHSVQRVARGQRDVFDKTCCSVQPFISLQQIVMEVDHSGS